MPVIACPITCSGRSLPQMLTSWYFLLCHVFHICQWSSKAGSRPGAARQALQVRANRHRYKFMLKLKKKKRGWLDVEFSQYQYPYRDTNRLDTVIICLSSLTRHRPKQLVFSLECLKSNRQNSGREGEYSFPVTLLKLHAQRFAITPHLSSSKCLLLSSWQKAEA